MNTGITKGNGLVTIEPCLIEAKILAGKTPKLQIPDDRNRRYVVVFTALADDDLSVGLLAYYIWRRRVRRRM